MSANVISVIIAAAALVVSIVNFIVSQRQIKSAARLNRRPRLVFVKNERGHLSIRNIGSGPATEVAIVQRVDETWDRPLRLPPIAVGAPDPIPIPRGWLPTGNRALAVRYQSSVKEPYATLQKDDGTEEYPADWDQLIHVDWSGAESYQSYR
jgi:hypothetical protein